MALSAFPFMDKVRIGIIGLGNIGQVHVGNLMDGKVPRGELTAVGDAIADKLPDYEAQGFGVHRLSTFTATEEEVLAQVRQKLEVIGDGGAARSLGFRLRPRSKMCVPRPLASAY